jgi:hypothetical protein
MMEVEASWAIFDQLRPKDEVLTVDSFSFYTCSNCGCNKTYTDAGLDLPTCTGCGIVDSEFLSDEAEWNPRGEDGPDMNRVGAPVNTDHFSAAWGMGTIIKGRNAAKMARIHHHSSMNHKDRALFHAYAELDRIGKVVLGLPDNVMYLAKTKYRQFNEAVLTRGAVRNGIKANCIFQACREFNVHRTTKEIADAFIIPAKDMSRTFEMYQEQLPETEVHVTTAAHIVPRIFNSVTCVPEDEKGRVKMKVAKFCNALDDCVDLMGRTPKAIVCAVIYVVLGDLGYSPNKADICKICDVSVPTLGKIEAIVRAELKDVKLK